MSRQQGQTAMHDIFELCDLVRETGFAIHKYHANGHLEKIYENALAHRLRKAGVKVEQQSELTVRDEDGTVLGEYAADLYIDDQLIVELKACRTIASEHEAQMLGYLRASDVEHGLLMNFGAPKYQIKKYIWRTSDGSGTHRLATCLPFMGTIGSLVINKLGIS